jgi:hypothetical protein
MAGPTLENKGHIPPAFAASEAIQVQIKQSSFKEGEPIVAEIINGLSLPIYTEMGKTDCSPVMLQAWNGRQWTPIFGCRLGIPQSPFEIRPGSVLPMLLNPQSIHLAGHAKQPGGPGIVEGLYRLRFSFRLGFRSFGRRDPFVVYSPSFRVLH